MSDVRSEPLGRLVQQHPGWVAVLEEFGIDGRGGTAHTLWAAADRAGVSIELVVAALAGPPTAVVECERLDDLSLRRVIDHVERVHHVRTRVLLDDLDTAASDLGDPVVSEAVARLRVELEGHLELEERALFPLCRDLLDAFSWPSFHAGPIDRPLDSVRHDHRRLDALVGDVVAALATTGTDREDGAEDPAAAVAAAVLDDLAIDLAVHLLEEETLLLPTARRLAEELAAG